jgi:hypothetical protein
MKLRKFIKTIIREYLDKQKILNEYVTRDIVSLKDYFSMPKSSKMKYLPYDYYYFFDDFLDETDTYFERPTDETYDDIDLIYWLENNDSETYNKFAQYLFDKITYHELPIPDAEYPAWCFYDDKPEIIKNQWLIHFTDDAYGIAKNGFKYGVDDMTKLGLTTNLSDFEKEYGGYNFAYTLNDFKKYGKYSHRKSGYKYGDEAVIFRASGIKVWHYGDEEPQVIFYGNTAKNIIPIISGENSNFGIYSKNDRLLYENDDLPKVVEWIINNYQQYRKNFTY